jgi:hypothetical protein
MNRFAIISVWDDLVIRLVWWSGFLIFLGLSPFTLGPYLRSLLQPLSFAYASQFTGVLWLLLWPVYYTIHWLAFLLIMCAGLVLIILPVYAITTIERFANPYFSYWPARLIILGWPLVITAAYAVLYTVLSPIVETIPSSSSPLWAAFGGGVDALGGLTAYFSILLIMIISIERLAWLFSYILERRKQRLYPEAVITLQLWTILTQVIKDPAAWGSLEMKHELVARLEIIASCLQYDLPRRLQSDIATDNWFQQMAEQMAAAQRALKPWVLMPKPDTYEQFIARIGKAFVHAATGEWDALPRSEGEPQTQRQRWRTRVTDVARALVIALVPLLGFWGIQQSPLAVPQPMAGYVTIGSLIWLVLTFLISLDSSFHAKLRVMEDVTQSVPFVGKWLGIGKKVS